MTWEKSERFLVPRIEAYLAGGGFTSNQFGFHKNRSTSDAALLWWLYATEMSMELP